MKKTLRKYLFVALACILMIGAWYIMGMRLKPIEAPMDLVRSVIGWIIIWVSYDVAQLGKK